jgi:hypothetical protein
MAPGLQPEQIIGFDAGHKLIEQNNRLKEENARLRTRLKQRGADDVLKAA